MTSNSETVPSASTTATARRQRGRTSLALEFPAALFVPLAGLLLLFLILLGLLVVVSTTYFGPQAASSGRLLDRGWALLSTSALVWAVVNLYWARAAVRVLDPFAIYGHFAMAIGCGLIALGIHAVLLARALGTQPIVMDYAHLGDVGAGASGEAAMVVPAQGDAEEGRKAFSTACITCHGPSGGGMPNLAPSLRGSPFIASADDTAIANVIRLGRPVGDPNNKTGKVMPARGGNPFLGDDKVVHLVAFIRAIQKEGAVVAPGGQDAGAPPAAQLAKWVVPAGPVPSSQLVELDARNDIGDAASIATRSDHRRQQLIQTLTLGLTGLHGLFLFGVMIVSSNVLLRRLANRSSKSDRSWWELASVGWVIALVAWLIVFIFVFLWLT
ncbi:MAG: cytochrome c [Pirellulaceae bacterium]|nr:cytochrome c [Pirellulaceae bacterium]